MSAISLHHHGGGCSSSSCRCSGSFSSSSIVVKAVTVTGAAAVVCSRRRRCNCKNDTNKLYTLAQKGSKALSFTNLLLFLLSYAAKSSSSDAPSQSKICVLLYVFVTSRIQVPPHMPSSRASLPSESFKFTIQTIIPCTLAN